MFLFQFKTNCFLIITYLYKCLDIYSQSKVISTLKNVIITMINNVVLIGKILSTYDF